MELPVLPSFAYIGLFLLVAILFPVATIVIPKILTSIG
ncbi:MAG: hypothetical protein HW384_759, partial [Dehalococcoidia bacterium]|nr:hypothetical protein [Dehalococcoidia bacterium]